MAVTLGWMLGGPQASEASQSSPIVSRVTEFCIAVCVLLSIVVHWTCKYAIVQPARGDDELARAGQLWQGTAVAAVVGLVYELSIRASMSMAGPRQENQEGPLLIAQARAHTKMILVFCVMAICYGCKACDERWAHSCSLLQYFTRACCIPVVFSVFGQLQQASATSRGNDILPSSLLVGVCVVASWQGTVVANGVVAWLCMGGTFLSYLLISKEQLQHAWSLKDAGLGGFYQAVVLVYVVLMLGVCCTVDCLRIQSWVSATLHNGIHCIADASSMLATSLVLVATHDFTCGGAGCGHAQDDGQPVVSPTPSQRDLQRFVDSAPLPIFSVDASGLVDQWNPKACELTGVSSERAMGRPLLAMLPDSQRGQAEEVISQALRGETADDLKATIVAPDDDPRQGSGQTEALAISASPRCDESGTIVGATFMGHGVAHVEDATEVQHQKDRFMAVISHELHTPLHGIITLAKSLREEEQDASRARLLTLVGNCATHLSGLVTNIMEMSALAPGEKTKAKPSTLQLQREPVEMSKLLEESVTLVRNSVDKIGRPLLKPGVELTHKAKPLPIIEADKERCKRALYHVFANACKFTTEGRITISSRADPNGRWLEVEVADTGPGICESARRRVFEPFEQEDNSDNRHFEGLGLGLSIAKEVVQLHGGDISMQSEVNVGTTVTIWLPTLSGSPHEAIGTPSTTCGSLCEYQGEVQDDSKGSIEAQRRRKRDVPLVLSVSEDQLHQLIVESAMQPAYNLVTVFDGTAALEYLRDCEDEIPDCMFLDIRLPGLTGYEVCREVRERLQLSASALPIFMTSHFPAQAVEARCMDSGANGYVGKPVEAGELRSLVANVVDY